MSFDLYNAFVEDNRLMYLFGFLGKRDLRGWPIILDNENFWQIIEYCAKYTNNIFMDANLQKMKARGHFFLNDRKTEHLIAYKKF
jgi:hypothetical protein